MTRAAHELGVSQSSISRRLAGLERTLNAALVIQSGREVRLTSVGRRLAQDVAQPLADLDRAVRTAADEGDSETGRVRFGFPLTMGSGLIPELVAAFHHRHPRVRLELKQAPGDELADDLAAGALDLAVTIPPAAGFRHRIVSSQSIVVALPERHRLAGSAGVALADLADETFIANPDSYDLRRSTERWCRAAGFVPAVGIEITEFATIRELVERGLGVALLPPTPEPVAGVVEVPVTSARLYREAAVVWPTTVTTPVVEKFADFLIGAVEW